MRTSSLYSCRACLEMRRHSWCVPVMAFRGCLRHSRAPARGGLHPLLWRRFPIQAIRALCQLAHMISTVPVQAAEVMAAHRWQNT